MFETVDVDMPFIPRGLIFFTLKPGYRRSRNAPWVALKRSLELASPVQLDRDAGASTAYRCFVSRTHPEQGSTF